MNRVDDDIEEILNDLQNITFDNEIQVTQSTQMVDDQTSTENETHIPYIPDDRSDLHYNTSNGNQIIKTLSIKVESNELPRFSCAAHKAEIAMRNAICRHASLVKMLATLSKYAGSVKHSINISKCFGEAKCRLKSQNKTRNWSSAFLMLNSFLKAYKKNVFTGI